MRFNYLKILFFLVISVGCSSKKVDQLQVSPQNFYFQAISRCDIDEFEKIRQKNNFSYDEQINSSVTPIMVAAYRGKENCVGYLLNKEVNLDIREENQRSVIFYAVEGKNEGVLSLILKSKKISKDHLNFPDRLNLIPIMTAAHLGLEAATQELFFNGSDINKVDENGWNSLFFAVSSGNFKVVKFLVENGAKFNIKDNEGLAPIDIAKEDGHQEIFEFLSKQTIVEGRK